MAKVIVVSADGHAVMPPAVWSEYLEPRYHDFLPALQEETKIFTGAMSLLNDMKLSPDTYDVFDRDGRYQSGRWQGLWDADVRLQEMDREGVTAEFVYPGDFRASDLGFSTMNGSYPFELVDAGVRAFDRWLLDAFGHARDRLLLVGPTGTCSDMDATLAEVEWVADHGFVGTFAPGFTSYAGMAPLDHASWEPLWSRYEERGLALVVHGGYGFDQGVAFSAIEEANAKVTAQGGGAMELVTALSQSFFNAEFFSDLRGRRAMWQMLLGGVFDRHPGLKLMMVEVRADWVPATLRRLDAAYTEHRAQVPAKRPPSDYWATNCMAGVSFMHRSEVEMRHEIGVETIDFGRDYPHTEGTWPNTLDYLRGLFAGVPERDVRMILGENVIRFLGLDRAHLAEIAARVGPTIETVTRGAEMDAALLEHLEDRCGFSRPAEGDSRIPEIEGLLRDDLSRLAGVG
jgi:predicted TIM-barrel fold metal-dependent hydrolase